MLAKAVAHHTTGKSSKADTNVLDYLNICQGETQFIYTAL